MTACRPLCVACHRAARQPYSHRCRDCGPGRIARAGPRPGDRGRGHLAIVAPPSRATPGLSRAIYLRRFSHTNYERNFHDEP